MYTDNEYAIESQSPPLVHKICYGIFTVNNGDYVTIYTMFCFSDETDFQFSISNV